MEESDELPLFSYPKSPQRQPYTKEYYERLSNHWHDVWYNYIHPWFQENEDRPEDELKAEMKSILQSKLDPSEFAKINWNKDFSAIFRKARSFAPKYQQLYEEASSLEPETPRVKAHQQHFEDFATGLDKVKSGEWTPTDFKNLVAKPYRYAKPKYTDRFRRKQYRYTPYFIHSDSGEEDRLVPHWKPVEPFYPYYPTVKDMQKKVDQANHEFARQAAIKHEDDMRRMMMQRGPAKLPNFDFDWVAESED